MSFVARPVYYIGQLTYYELNIDYIIETYCVNKDKPELKCNGKCHLAKKLQVVSGSKIDANTKVTFNLAASFYPVFYNLYPNIIFKQALFIGDVKNTFFYNRAYLVTFISNFFRPPIL